MVHTFLASGGYPPSRLKLWSCKTKHSTSNLSNKMHFCIKQGMYVIHYVTKTEIIQQH